MMRETGCDGVMVGRAAISNPWALRDIVREVRRLNPLPPPNLNDRIEAALEHLRLMIAHEGEVEDWREAVGTQSEVYACRHLRGQIPMYVKGAYGAAQLREKLTRCNAYSEYEELLRKFEQDTLAGVL